MWRDLVKMERLKPIEPRKPMDCEHLGWYYYCDKRDILADPYTCARCEKYKKEQGEEN